MAERVRTRGPSADPEFADEQQPAEDEPRRVARSRRSPGRRRPAVREPEPAEDELAAADEELADDIEEAIDEEQDPVDDEDELEDRAAGEPAANGRRRAPRAAGRDGSVRTAKQAVRAALRQIAELTAKPPEEITGVEPAEDGCWRIRLEVVEDRRIPSSADILATYETTIDADGELRSYRRVGRYARGRGDS